MAQVFSCEIYKISKNIFFTEYLLVTASVYNKKAIQSYVTNNSLNFVRLENKIGVKCIEWNICFLQIITNLSLEMSENFESKSWI